MNYKIIGWKWKIILMRFWIYQGHVPYNEGSIAKCLDGGQ
jgi:hypothetical protein